MSWLTSELRLRLAPSNWFKASIKIILLTVPRRYFFCGSFVSYLSCVCHVLRLFIVDMWLTCLERVDLLVLVCDVKLCFVTFPCGILGQVWYLIVSFPDLCHLSYFELPNEVSEVEHKQKVILWNYIYIIRTKRRLRLHSPSLQIPKSTTTSSVTFTFFTDSTVDYYIFGYIHLLYRFHSRLLHLRLHSPSLQIPQSTTTSSVTFTFFTDSTVDYYM